MPSRLRMEHGFGTRPPSTPENIDRRTDRPVEQRIMITIPFEVSRSPQARQR